MRNHLKPGNGHGNIAERVAATKARESPATSHRPGQHVIYTTDLGTELQALLVEWRRAGEQWEASVIYVTEVRAGRWGTITEWVPADRVRRAT